MEVIATQDPFYNPSLQSCHHHYNEAHNDSVYSEKLFLDVLTPRLVRPSEY